MTSRRQFIKKAGIISSIASIPFESFSSPGDESLQAVTRKQLLVPSSRIYLNTGSLGPSPQPVLDAVATASRQLEMNPVSENWGALGNQMEAVRKKVADFIHSGVNEVLLTRNTTEGLGLICQSLAIEKGDELLTTTLEHGGGEVGLEFLEKTKGAVIRKIELPLPPKNVQEVVQTITSAITTRTRMVMLSHVNTVTGMRMPFAEIAAFTRPKGIILIADGAQAPGLIPIDVKALGVDAYATSGHKWLLGPKETGFVYLREEFQPKVRPLFSFSGFDAYSKSSGTRNVATIIGLGASVDWHQQIGVDRIEVSCLETRNHCLTELKKLRGLWVISPEDKALSTGIVSFSLASVKNSDVYEQLKQKDIVVKVLTQHNAIRISCHIFTSKSDIDTFIGSLSAILQKS